MRRNSAKEVSPLLSRKKGTISRTFGVFAQPLISQDKYAYVYLPKPKQNLSNIHKRHVSSKFLYILKIATLAMCSELASEIPWAQLLYQAESELTHKKPTAPSFIRISQFCSETYGELYTVDLDY